MIKLWSVGTAVNSKMNHKKKNSQVIKAMIQEGT